jgi:hypothetical protein
MTSLTATTEIGPVWIFRCEGIGLLARADALVLNSHGAIAAGLGRIHP